MATDKRGRRESIDEQIVIFTGASSDGNLYQL